MSIYSSWLSISDDDHEDGCAVYAELEPGILDFSGNPCDCGVPSAPIVYEGSHILPKQSDRRGGELHIAAIPNHITREDDNGGAEGLHDFLRISLASDDSTRCGDSGPCVPGGSGDLLLDRLAVERLRDMLTAWLDAETRW